MKDEGNMNLIMENWRGFLTEEQKRNKVNLLLEKLDSDKEKNILTEEEVLFILEEGTDSQVMKFLSKGWGAVANTVQKLTGVFFKASKLSNKLLDMAAQFEESEKNAKGQPQSASLRKGLSGLLAAFEQRPELKKVTLKKLRVFNKLSAVQIRFYSAIRGFAVLSNDIEKAKQAGLQAIEKAKSVINENELADEGSAKKEAKEVLSQGFEKLKQVITFAEQANNNYEAIQNAKKNMEGLLNKHLSEEEDMTIYKFIENVSIALIEKDHTGHYKDYRTAKQDLVAFVDTYKNADTVFKDFKTMSSEMGTGAMTAYTIFNFFKTVGGGKLVAGTIVKFFLKLIGVAAVSPAAVKILTAALAAQAVIKIFNQLSKLAYQKENIENYEAAMKALTPQETG